MATDGYRSCAHPPTLENHRPGTHLVNKLAMVPLLCPESLTRRSRYDRFPQFFVCAFLPSITFFHFHRTLSRGLAGACVNPGSFFKLSFYAFTSLSNNSHFLMDFSQT